MAALPTFVCAHGAGGHKDDRGMLRLAEALQPCLEVVRFDFPYREQGSKRPDPMPVLKASIAAVADRTRAASGRLLLGGRSMGGRAASMLAADGFACDGLLLFAYPLHPAGRPEKLRTAHLASLTVPVLCFNGTRDPLCTRGLMAQALAQVRTRWDMHWLEGADHSFRTLKSSGRSEAQTYEEIARAAARWLETL
ncbi:MAG TPA: alpha/beta family hydrolase [Burkholderiales bacterium]|nr:alpha/beta family hydrolase [Burkholderiales bacterium]